MAAVIAQYGAWTYGLLFFVIFMETGFVVTPFLPGNSLIFAAGTFPAIGSMNLWLLLILSMIAATAGNTVNYWIGYWIGDEAKNIKWIKQEYMDRTHAFFEKYGGKTGLPGARFVPMTAPLRCSSLAWAKCPLIISQCITFPAVWRGWRSSRSPVISLATFHSCAIIFPLS